MANKAKKKAPSIFVLKWLVTVLFLVFAGFILYERVIDILSHSPYFTVKDIWYEASLKSIESSELASLKGKSLFKVDLRKVQRQLQYRYPQYGQLQVKRRFPNQILVVARQRVPFAQLKSGAKTLTLDEHAIILSAAESADSHLPLIIGVNADGMALETGKAVRDRELTVALEILKAYSQEKTLSFHPISRIDMSNMSEISFFIADEIKVIIDEENFREKIRMLGLFIAQVKLDPQQIKYIDLRFKEPILGKK